MSNCLACSGTRFSHQGPIQICLNCGLGETVSFSAYDYSSYHRDSTYVVESQLLRNIFLYRYRLVSRWCRPGKVLDIGCSTGEFLDIFRTYGWQVQGVESSGAARVAVDRGLSVARSTFEAVSLSGNQFNLVVANHVLEHVLNPVGFLSKCHRLLKPQGFILLDQPNFGSVSAQILGPHWPYLLPTEHHWHFTYPSLKLLLARTGFKLVYWEAKSGIWSLARPFSLRFKKRFLVDLILALPHWWESCFKMGSDLLIIAQKR